MNIYDIWFSRIEISNSIKLRLLKYFKPCQIWDMDRVDLINRGLREITINEILNKKYREKNEQYFDYLQNHEIHLMTLNDYYYPQKLMDIPDKPAYLFIKGNKKILNDDSVAIIGSRLCTNARKETCI